MENINIGIVKTMISHKAKDEFLVNNTLNESKTIISHFYRLVEGSEILRKEFNLFRNLESKHIPNDVLATRYIDENVQIFSKYTPEEVLKEHAKLAPYIEDYNFSTVLAENKIKLYDAINNLILETSKKNNDTPDVDIIHESFVTILSNLVEKKKDNLKEHINSFNIPKNIDPTILLEVAMRKFNEKYSILNEEENKIVKTLVIGSEENKKEIFESLRSENLSIISKIEDNNLIDKINETVDKLSVMEYSSNTSIKDIINLHELKQNLS